LNSSLVRGVYFGHFVQPNTAEGCSFGYSGRFRLCGQNSFLFAFRSSKGVCVKGMSVQAAVPFVFGEPRVILGVDNREFALG
jgi:hypothetical protein